jgi:signal transduction histidine kinase
VKLRLRVVLATVAAVWPALALLAWSRVSERESAIVRALDDVALSRMRAERALCERTPETWPQDASGLAARRLALAERAGASDGWTSRIQLHAYDDQLSSRNPAAPALAPILKAAASANPTTTHERRFELNGQPALEILRRTPWGSGPCAFVLARLPGRPSSRGQLPLAILLPTTLLAVGAVLLATAPVVRRIRQLTREVESSKRGNYENTISVRGTDEIGELASAFVEAGREVRVQIARQEQREKTLRTFLENTTHDVMIPLTVLQGHLARLRERAAAGERIEASSIVTAMIEAHYMTSLIHNLAMAAKLETGEPLLLQEPVNLNDVVEGGVGRHAPIARQRGVILDHAVPAQAIWACGDVTLLEQALSNVVYNAIRYNRDGGHVAVLLEQCGEEGRGADERRFRLRVVDDGPGIPEQERALFSERYVRGNVARSREPHGHGLGLSIAFRVTQVHGWELSLSESEFGGLEVTMFGVSCDPPAGVRQT